MRLFFALWPDAASRARCAALAEGLTLTRPARLVPSENYHATLAFIGEIDDSRVAAVQRIGAAQRVSRCAIQFDGCEFWRQPQVLVCIARQAPDELLGLACRLRGAVSAMMAGPDTQDQPLRLHVTLARKVVQASVQPAMSFSWEARSFSLIRSERGSAPVYTVVDTWSLLDKP